MNPGFNSIVGIGTDIIELDRVKKAVQRHGERLLSRLFTENELLYCQKYADPTPNFAGRFAAKEAIVKALGTGFQKGVSWTEIEILNNSLGKPEVKFSPSLQTRFPHINILISISHCRAYATASAIAVTTE